MTTLRTPENETSIDPFRVPNIGNTCYISSLLFGLFYNPEGNEYMLNRDISDVNAIYLQEIINQHFVQRIRRSITVPEEVMEQIRYYCRELGWKTIPEEEIFAQQDVNEFYMFLLEQLNGIQIKIQSETITESAIKSPDDIGEETDIPYIPLALPIDSKIESINIKEMLDSWLSDNIKEVTRKVKDDYGNIEEKLVRALDVKHITNIPPIIPVGINRFQNIRDENGEFKIIRNNTHVYIQKTISPFKNANYLSRREWEFHAAICHKGPTQHSGHYYCLVRDSNDRFHLFDDLKIPSLVEVKMDDPEITNILKKECVFVLYRHKV